MKLFLVFLVVGILGCSSQPQVATMENPDRDQYAKSVREQLKDWDKEVSKMNAVQAANVRASLEDTRAELRSLENSAASDWSTERMRVENRMVNVREKIRQAKNN